ncbi:MAG: ATP-binding protein [Candidatus Omnitrophica bacterium]|nr:ATP-binding protein [Candidatus Omnitrophota bacterium]
MFSDPVVGGDFFGRQAILDLLVKRAKALRSGYRQNVAIIGHQQMGKTSILRQFLHLHPDPETLAMYVEIKLQALDYFVDQFTRALLFQVLIQKEKVDSTESLENLAAKAAPLIPKTVERIHEIAGLLKQRHAEEAYSKLFALTSIVKEETGKNCIVILDEFHRLGEFGIRSAFSDFGKRIMVQKETMYVLASSSFSASRKILAEKLALLFGNFERIYLEPFDFGTSFDFIDKGLLPARIPRPLKYFLAALTDGHPFFLRTVVSRVRELAAAKAEAEVSRQTLAETLAQLLFESQGVLYQYFLTLISPWMRSDVRGSQILILVELAKGKSRLKDIARAVNRGQKETSAQIKELMEYELVVKTGVFYRFHNKIFKFWLKEVYEKKELSLLGTVGKREEFLSSMDEKFSEFETLLGMDPSDRLLSLFGSFQNDLVEFGEKKRKLPHFTEILKTEPAANPVRGSAREIIARGHGRCWVCKVVEEKAGEKDVLSLVSGPKKSGTVPTRVFIALGGLDENAKLLAKEKKIFTLGLSRVNLLMDVYGQSPIMNTYRECDEAKKLS